MYNDLDFLLDSEELAQEPLVEKTRPANRSRKGGRHLRAGHRTWAGSHFVSCLPVIVVFCVVTVFAWMLPLRPTVSENEKRSLEEFPEFTVKVLASGTYFDDIGLWFSDTFTFRETWIDAAVGMEALYGARSTTIYGDIGESDDIPELNLSQRPGADTVVQPDNSGATAEDATGTDGTTVDTQPEETETSGDDSQNAGENTADTNPSVDETAGEDEGIIPDDSSSSDDGDSDGDTAFDPMAEGEIEEAPEDATQTSWGGQVIEEDDYVGTGAVIQIGDAAYKITGFSQYYADLYIETMNEAAELLDGKARLFTVLVPENTTFMLTAEDRTAMGCKLEEDAIAYMYSGMDIRNNVVNVVDNLIAHNSEYLAFRTDHHWTALGAYYAYEAWCEVAGFEPVPLDEYEVIEYPGFLGTYYSKANKSHLLAENPDTVVCYVPPGDITLYLNDGDGDGLGWEQALITNRTNSQPGSKYLAFLAGDHSKATFINDSITDGSSCLVVKTSVGNPYVYYLTQHYQYVYVIDIRYYFGRGLVSFVEHFEIDDVLFVHGAGLAMGKGGSGLLSNFVR